MILLQVMNMFSCSKCVFYCLYSVQIARVLSGFFLVIQIILLLGFIYAINEYLIDKDHISHKIALIGATVSMYACGLVIIGFMFHYYAPAASCSLNIFFITWTLILGIAYSIFSVMFKSMMISLGCHCCAMSHFPRVGNM